MKPRAAAKPPRKVKEMKLTHNKLNTIGGIPYFTTEGAVEAFKTLAKVVYADLTQESSIVLSEAAERLHELGFSWNEIEAFEISAIA